MITHRQLDEAQLLPSLFKSLKLKIRDEIDRIFAVRLEYLRERTCKCRIVLHITMAISWPLAGQGVITCHTRHNTRVWNFCQNKFCSSQLWIMKSLMQRTLHYTAPGPVSRRHEVSGRGGEAGSRSWRSFSISYFFGKSNKCKWVFDFFKEVRLYSYIYSELF